MAPLSQFVLFVLLLHIVPPSKCDDLQIFQSTNISSEAHMNIPVRLMALEQTMAIIVGELQEYRSSDKKKFIPEGDIVADINQGRFAIAEEKMLKLHDPEIVRNIVRDVSAYSDQGFRVLVDLAKGLNNPLLRSQLLLNLYHQAKEGDQISTVNLIALAKCFSEKGNGYQRGRIIGITSFNKLLDQVTKGTIATFVDVMKWQGDYQTNSEVRAVAADIAEWGDVSQKVMIGFVSDVFGTVDSKKILEAVCNHTDTWQALVGVDTLIERLKDADSLKGSIAEDIASHLNELVTRMDVNSTVQDYARRVSDKIPEYIRNLKTLTNFCIWNDYKGFFLVSPHFYYDKSKLLSRAILQRRWENGSTPIGAEWRQQRNQEKLYFKNVKYADEALHAYNITEPNSYGVFLKKPTGELDDKYAWILEPAGDSFFLKNYWNNEYLFASDVKNEQNEHKIAGTKYKRSGSTDENPEFAWQIVKC